MNRVTVDCACERLRHTASGCGSWPLPCRKTDQIWQITTPKRGVSLRYVWQINKLTTPYAMPFHIAFLSKCVLDRLELSITSERKNKAGSSHNHENQCSSPNTIRQTVSTCFAQAVSSAYVDWRIIGICLITAAGRQL